MSDKPKFGPDDVVGWLTDTELEDDIRGFRVKFKYISPEIQAFLNSDGKLERLKSFIEGINDQGSGTASARAYGQALIDVVLEIDRLISEQEKP